MAAANDASPSESLGAVRALWRLREYAGKAAPAFAGSAVAALLAWLAGLLTAQVLGKIIDGPLANRDAAAVIPFAMLVLGLGLVQVVGFAVRRILISNSGTRVEARMRNALYAKLQDLPVAFHDQWPSGQLLSRAISDLSLIRSWLSFGLVMIVVNIFSSIIGVVTLLSINWMLGIVFFLSVMPLWWLGLRFEGNYRAKSRLSQDQVGDLATAVEESVHGIRILKAFGRGENSLGRFHAQAEDLRKTELSKAWLGSNITMWVILLPTLGLGITLILGCWQVADHTLSVGALVAFFASAATLNWPLQSIGGLLAMALDARTATDRFFDIMNAPVAIADPSTETVLPSPVRGELRFDHVRYRYPDAPADSPPLLVDVDLALIPGETMALVGLTGSGKSTMLSFAARLYDVSGGAVLLDGVDVRKLSRTELRTHVAMAFEDAVLFSSSVRDNVLIGCGETDEEVRSQVLEQALRIAQADFVARLPQGADTRIGEEGLSLSGGQRQRVALARAIAAQAAVLVLDDPLSALDVETEERVQRELRKYLVGTTVLVVAHRSSTVALADRVALLDGGRITKVGTHRELLATSARYRYVISNLENDYAPPEFSETDQYLLDTAAIQLAEIGERLHPPTGSFSAVQ